MKITLTQYDKTYTVETLHDDLDRTEMIAAFYGLLGSAGYHIQDLMDELEL